MAQFGSSQHCTVEGKGQIMRKNSVQHMLLGIEMKQHVRFLFLTCSLSHLRWAEFLEETLPPYLLLNLSFPPSLMPFSCTSGNNKNEIILQKTASVFQEWVLEGTLIKNRKCPQEFLDCKAGGLFSQPHPFIRKTKEKSTTQMWSFDFISKQHLSIW